MKRIKILLGAGVALLCSTFIAFIPTAALAAAPDSINFQGRLQDGSGNPVTTATNVAYRIYDGPAGGANLLWGPETHTVTPDAGGLYNVTLGSLLAFPSNLFASTPRYLGITVAADPELAPRTLIASVAYSLRVKTVDSASGGNITSKVSIGPGHTNTGADAFVAGNTNTASGNYSFAVGIGNTASGVNATVGGGHNNVASGFNAAVGGGGFNNATGSSGATISGGNSNTASATVSTVGGGAVNTAGNARATVSGGFNNHAAGFGSTVGGGENDTAIGAYSTIGGGYRSGALGDSATVAGGAGNTAGNTLATVSGGRNNRALGLGSTVGGGSANLANGDHAAVSGGSSNTAGALGATVGGGLDNSAGDFYSTVSGGANNSADFGATVGGGGINTASGTYSMIGGGLSNIADNTYSTISGGRNNRARGQFATVSGGGGNTLADSNAALGEWSTVGGGRGNVASGSRSTVAGGHGGLASGELASVGGGIGNLAIGLEATIAGGFNNTASGNASTVAGGEYDSATGQNSTVPGGEENLAGGDYSFAAGRKAKAQHTGSFVWADEGGPFGTDFASTGANQFLIRADGGMGINTNAPYADANTDLTLPGSIGFKNGTAPMLYIYESGSSNSERPIISHSPFFPTYGLKYNDVADQFVFQSFGSPVMTVGVSGSVEVLDVNGNVTVGTGTTGCVKDADGTVIAGTCSSDERLKTKIEPFPDVLEKLARLEPVHFYWKAEEFPEKHFGKNQSFGLIAQEVEKILPDLVTEDEEGFKAVRYSKLPLLLLQGMKEQQKTIDDLQDEVSRLKELVELLLSSERKNVIQPASLEVGLQK